MKKNQAQFRRLNISNAKVSTSKELAKFIEFILPIINQIQRKLGNLSANNQFKSPKSMIQVLNKQTKDQVKLKWVVLIGRLISKNLLTNHTKTPFSVLI
ncbi:MAG: hypothetical protein AAF705_12815, partial [Bacteroidota bacterium]